MKNRLVNLSTEDALIFQQISESGEEDVVSLSRELGIKRQRVLVALDRLKRKGLIVVKHTAGDWWIYMSTRGKQLSRYVWPEIPYPASI